MADFEKAVAVVLDHEGNKFVNRPETGECSKFGLTLKTLNDFGYDLTPADIEAMSEPEAEAYYREVFWDEYAFQSIADDVLGTKIFDMAVNMGPREAFTLAQDACNRTNNAGLKTDGVLGPKTLDALNAGPTDAIIRELKAGQMEFYELLAASHPEHQKDLPGWIKRANWPEAA